MFAASIRNVKALLPLPALLPFACFAQTDTVHVGGSTQSPPAPYYTPQHITIDAGGTVVWVRDNGTHNINGTTFLFPGNPEDLYSGTPDDTVFPWSHTFTIPGTYHYHCDQKGHSATQFGSITVLDPIGIVEHGAAAITLFPVPANGVLMVEAADLDIREVEITTMDGRLVQSASVHGADRIEISVEGLAAGPYIVILREANGTVITRPFITN